MPIRQLAFRDTDCEQLTNQEDSSVYSNPRPPPDILQHATLDKVAKVLHHGILVEAGSNQGRERELDRSARYRKHQQDLRAHIRT